MTDATITVTRKQVDLAVGEVLFNVMNFPPRVQLRLAGQDMTPLREKIVSAIFDRAEKREV